MNTSLKQMEDKIRHQDGAKEYKGHDYLDLERFSDTVKHMIIFDVLSNEAPVGRKGTRMRWYLSELGYQRAKDTESKGDIKIVSHAKVNHGELTYDRGNQLR